MINTIDIDYASFTNRYIRVYHIKTKILKCKYCKYLFLSYTYSGAHITIHCTKPCDICRVVYDDINRLRYDMVKPFHECNILFDNYQIGLR